MALGRQESEMHRRRKSMNLLILGLLVGFVALIFAVTIVKMSNGQMMEGFDHQFRPSLLPMIEEGS